MFKKELVYRVLDRSGINSIIRKTAKSDEVKVLMYHGVLPDDDKSGNGNWLQVKESEFRQQMHHLCEHYEVVPLEDAWERREYNYQSGKPKVAITFDDGYRNNWSVAFPILKAYNLPASIFLVSGLIDTNKIMWYDRLHLALSYLGYAPKVIDEKVESFKELHPSKIDDAVDTYLSSIVAFGDLTKYDSGGYFNKFVDSYGYLKQYQIEDMERSHLISFGSHTHNHEILTELSLDEVRKTLVQSEQYLEEHDIFQSGVFCTPNGRFNEDHVKIFKDLGYDYNVTTKPGTWKITGEDFHISRYGIGRKCSIERFSSIVAGSQNLIQKLRNVI